MSAAYYQQSPNAWPIPAASFTVVKGTSPVGKFRATTTDVEFVFDAQGARCDGFPMSIGGFILYYGDDAVIPAGQITRKYQGEALGTGVSEVPMGGIQANTDNMRCRALLTGLTVGKTYRYEIAGTVCGGYGTMWAEPTDSHTSIASSGGYAGATTAQPDYGFCIATRTNEATPHICVFLQRHGWNGVDDRYKSRVALTSAESNTGRIALTQDGTKAVVTNFYAGTLTGKQISVIDTGVPAAPPEAGHDMVPASIIAQFNMATNDQPYGLGLTRDEMTYLPSAGIDAVVTTITVASTAGFPAVGVIKIDNEEISHTGTTATTFTGCTRGANGTTAATHAVGATARTVVYALASVYAGTNAGKLAKMNIVTGVVTYSAVLGTASTCQPYDLSLDPAGIHVYVPLTLEGKVVKVRISDLVIIGTASGMTNVRDVAVDSTGATVYATGGAAGAARIWHITTSTMALAATVNLRGAGGAPGVTDANAVPYKIEIFPDDQACMIVSGDTVNTAKIWHYVPSYQACYTQWTSGIMGNKAANGFFDVALTPYGDIWLPNGNSVAVECWPGCKIGLNNPAVFGLPSGLVSIEGGV